MPDPRILIVDDEALVLLDLAMTVEELGYSVFCDCTTISSALSRLEDGTPDAALLDIDVGGTPVWPLARELKARNCPIVFVSANNGHPELKGEFSAAKFVDKPASRNDLDSALRHALP